MAHIIGGSLVLVSLIMVLLNNNRMLALDIYRVLVLLLLFSLALSVHGLSHLGLEKAYGYSPYNVFCLRHESKYEKRHGSKYEGKHESKSGEKHKSE
jgi:hypothetical protein